MGKVNINGKTYDTGMSGKIEVKNGIVTVDGKIVTEEKAEGKIIFEMHGDIALLRCDADVVVHGNIAGDAFVSGNMTCRDVKGDVKASGNVSCDDIGKNLEAGGNVSADVVHGNAKCAGNMVIG